MDFYGGGVLPDNSDGFQNYENAGATGSFAFFTLAALCDLGRPDDADKILFPMLNTYGECGFEGRDAKGHSNDWRRWTVPLSATKVSSQTTTTPSSRFPRGKQRSHGRQAFARASARKSADTSIEIR